MRDGNKCNHLSEAISEMQNSGYDVAEIVADGSVHRFGPEAHSKPQWYVAFSNTSVLTGEIHLTVVYGDWRTGEKAVFRPNKNTRLSPEDRAEINEQITRAKMKAEAEKKQLQDDIALVCQMRWTSLAETGVSPYMNQKGVKPPPGVRFDGEVLFVPCLDANGKLWSLQSVHPNGAKYFEKGGRTEGCFCFIGRNPPEEIIYIAEGIATAASIHEATDKPVVIAFNAGNLMTVSLALKQKYPTTQLVVCGDDDQWTTDKKGNLINPGRSKAERAAKSVNGFSIFPRFTSLDTRPTDFNDLHCLEGLGAVAEQLHSLPPTSQPLVQDDGGAVGKSQLIPADLAEKYLCARNYRTSSDLHFRYYRDEIFAWNGTHYDALPDEELGADIVRWLQSGALRASARTKLRNEIVANLQAIALLHGKNEMPFWTNDPALLADNFIVLENGILDTNKLLRYHRQPMSAHDPRFFNLSCLPFAFEPRAQCPTWLDFLNIVQPDPAHQRLLQMWFGYNLVYDTTQEKFMLYVGEGANGKTVAVTVQRELLGQNNVSAVPLEQFRPDRTFPLAHTVGKLANIVAELNEIKKVEEGELKKFVTGELMTAERKFKSPFTFKPTARLTFATNVLPHFTDRSHGLWRRAIVLPFSVQVPEDRQNKRLIDPKFWKESGELAGIFNWAIAGLVELRSVGRFEEPTACTALKEEYVRDCNPAKSFLLENCREEGGQFTMSQYLYERYKQWAVDGGFYPLSIANFSKEVPRAFPSVKKSENVERHNGLRSHVWRGLEYMGSLM